MSSLLMAPLLLLLSSTVYTANAVDVRVHRSNGLRRHLQTNNSDTEDNEFYLPDIDSTQNWLFGAGDSSEWGATAIIDETSNETNHHRPTLINITALDAGEYVTDTSAGTLHSAVVTNQGRILTASSVVIQTSGIGRDTFDGEQLDFQPIEEVYYLDDVIDDSITHDTNPSTPPTFVKIFASQYYTVALDTAGNAWSTGVNNYGNLCLGDTIARDRFHQVPIATTSEEEEESTKVVDIALGERHTLFLMDNGTVFGCGWNVWGQLGIGLKGENMLAPVEILIDEPDFNSTTNVPIVSNVTQIAAGRGSSYFLTSSDHVYASGTNYEGELCLGDRVDRPLPTMLSHVEDIQNEGDDFSLNDEGVVVRLIVAGKSSFYMLFSDGQVLACGKNTHSQLGSDSINNTAVNSTGDVASDVPAAIASLTNVTNIFASAISFTAFFLQNDGIHGAGQDSSNQIGNGDMLRNQLSEVSCPNEERAAFGHHNIIISSGNDHTLFLVNSQGIFDCEGNNTNSSLVPTTTSVPSISPTFYTTTASPQSETYVPTGVPTQIPTGSPVEESDGDKPNGGVRVSAMEVMCLGAAFAAWLLT